MPIVTANMKPAKVDLNLRPYFQDLDLVLDAGVIASGGTVQSALGLIIPDMDWARSFLIYLQCDQACQPVIYRGVLNTAGTYTFDWGRSIGTATTNTNGTTWAVIEAINIPGSQAIKFELINTSATTATTFARLRVHALR